MTRERWRQIEETFEAAAQIEPEKRAAYTAEVCGEDHELRDEVDAMFVLDGQFPELLHTGIQREAEWLSSDVGASVIGQRVGAYRIDGVLGRGGMGAVYLAVREDDVYEKRVALKLVKRGMDTDDVVR